MRNLADGDANEGGRGEERGMKGRGGERVEEREKQEREGGGEGEKMEREEQERGE